MGNWRTVNISGHIDPRDIAAIKKLLSYNDSDPRREFHCLSNAVQSPALRGVNDWVEENLDTIGNLSERDYEPEDVADVLRSVSAVSQHNPHIIIDCGDDHEKLNCICTVVLKDGEVTINDPRIETIKGFY